MKAVKETVRKYYKYGTTPNVNIVGSPTISNGVVSDFSKTNYLTLPTAFQPSTKNWEIVLKINWVNPGYNGIFIGNRQSGYFRLGFTSSNTIALALSTNSSSFNIGTLYGTTSMVENQDYWVKATFDGAKYQIFLSSDGVNYNLENTLNSSSIPQYQSLTTLGAGNNLQSDIQWMAGSLDLKKCYIKIGGEEFWRGTLVEDGTASDYDFYEDTDIYKVVKDIARKYYKYGWEQVASTFTPTGTITATSGWTNALDAFDNNASTYAFCGTSRDYIDIVFDNLIKITGFNASGYYVDSASRACNVSIHNVASGVDTLIANGVGASKSSTYNTGATFDGIETNHIRFYLINSTEGTPPTTTYKTRIREITITAKKQVVVEATSSDYDYYVDTDIYKAFNI